MEINTSNRMPIQNQYQLNTEKTKQILQQFNENGIKNIAARTVNRDMLELTSNNMVYGFDERYIEEQNYRMSHTITHDTTWFFQAAGTELEEAKSKKGRYDGSDIVNAYGLAYAKLYEEIEKRYESGEQYFDFDGTPLTKEIEIERLNKEYDNAVAWQKACAKQMAGIRHFSGKIPEVPKKDIEKLGDIFYKSKDKYMEMHRESRQTGKPLIRQNFHLGNSALLSLLV